jgi:hypothetical protein
VKCSGRGNWRLRDKSLIDKAKVENSDIMTPGKQRSEIPAKCPKSGDPPLVCAK